MAMSSLSSESLTAATASPPLLDRPFSSCMAYSCRLAIRGSAIRPTNLLASYLRRKVSMSGSAMCVALGGAMATSPFLGVPRTFGTGVGTNWQQRTCPRWWGSFIMSQDQAFTSLGILRGKSKVSDADPMQYSQGTLLALVALNDERVSKMIAAVALLAPVGYLSNATAPFFRTAVRLEIDKALKNAGISEVNIWSKPTMRVLNQVCAYDVKICRNLLASITGPNCCFNGSRIKDYLNNEPQPTSTKNLEHYFQMARKGTCSKFDYGFAGNLLHYGSFTAPPCDFSKIPNELPMLISYGGKDTLADIQDVRFLLGKLPQNANILYLEEFAHMDFIYGTNAKADLYDKVMEFFRS